jgi:hypothetical protein
MLNILPDYIYNVNNEKTIDTNLIEMDAKIVAKLREV